ncbi:hypothetical protein VULLAG_LOCUS4933 [Vulpes lagopus]
MRDPELADGGGAAGGTSRGRSHAPAQAPPPCAALRARPGAGRLTGARRQRRGPMSEAAGGGAPARWRSAQGGAWLLARGTRPLGLAPPALPRSGRGRRRSAALRHRVLKSPWKWIVHL